MTNYHSNRPPVEGCPIEEKTLRERAWTDEQKAEAVRTPKVVAQNLYDEGMPCNCDLNKWQPEPSTGHSRVCRIHKAAVIAALRIDAGATP